MCENHQYVCSRRIQLWRTAAVWSVRQQLVHFLLYHQIIMIRTNNLLTSDCVFVGTQEPWQQQQVEEIHQRQDVVAKEASCRDKEQNSVE